MRTPTSTGGSGSQKIFFITPEARAAGWDNEFTKQGAPTVMRLYPFFAGTVPQAQLIFGGTAQGKELLGDIVTQYNTITSFGPGKVSGVVEMTDGEAGVANPVNILFEKLKELKECDATTLSPENLELYRTVRGWAFEFKKGDQRPNINVPRTSLFMRGLCTLLKGEVPVNYVTKVQEPQHKVILRVSSSAIKSLVSAMTTPFDAAHPLSVENSELGDLVGINGYSVRISDYTEMSETNMPIMRYKVERDIAIALDPQIVWGDIYENGRFNDWDSLIYRPTAKELVQRLSVATSTAAVVYAFGDHPVYSKCLPQHMITLPAAAPGVAPQTPAPPAVSSLVSHPQYVAMAAANIPHEGILAALATMGIVETPAPAAVVSITQHPQYVAMAAANIPHEGILAALATMGIGADQVPGLPPAPAPIPAVAPTPAPAPVGAPPVQAPSVQAPPVQAPPPAAAAPTGPITTPPAGAGEASLDALTRQMEAAQTQQDEYASEAAEEASVQGEV